MAGIDSFGARKQGGELGATILSLVEREQNAAVGASARLSGLASSRGNVQRRARPQQLGGLSSLGGDTNTAQRAGGIMGGLKAGNGRPAA